MADLKKIYQKMCMSSVFHSVLDSPLIKRFESYISAPLGSELKLKAYSSFVSLIYSDGGSLTDLVSKLVFEDG